jgi:hypothetical protein
MSICVRMWVTYLLRWHIFLLCVMIKISRMVKKWTLQKNQPVINGSDAILYQSKPSAGTSNVWSALLLTPMLFWSSLAGRQRVQAPSALEKNQGTEEHFAQQNDSHPWGDILARRLEGFNLYSSTFFCLVIHANDDRSRKHFIIFRRRNWKHPKKDRNGTVSAARYTVAPLINLTKQD